MSYKSNLANIKIKSPTKTQAYKTYQAQRKKYEGQINNPTYTDSNGKKVSYDKTISSILDQVNNMGDFSTDKSGYYQSAYNTYNKMYRDQGAVNMRNAQADATARTGGFGNSYGTTAGAQANQQSLNQFNSMLASLYQTGAEMFNQRKSDLMSQAGVWQAERSQQIERSNTLLSQATTDFSTRLTAYYQKLGIDISKWSTLASL